MGAPRRRPGKSSKTANPVGTAYLESEAKTGSEIPARRDANANVDADKRKVSFRQNFPSLFPKYFTRSYNGWAAAVEFFDSKLSETVVLNHIVSIVENDCTVYRNLDVGGVIMVAFSEEEHYRAFLERRTLVVKRVHLSIVPTYYSTGTRMQIHVERLENAPRHMIEAQLHELFKDCGKIIHFQYPHNKESACNRYPFMDFVLDIPPGTPHDLMLPRVAPLVGINTMFVWPFGGRLCFRCGEDTHIKRVCPKGKTYNIRKAPLRETPLMAYAFPDRVEREKDPTSH